MKPVSLRFKCFGPYMQEQYIDFSKLEQNGLFLICGETGAGKTTILDAMCYALYGKSSGGLRGDMSVMRCKLAQKKDETLVEFIFDCKQRRYKFTRSLKYGNKNLNDRHNCLVLEDGVFVPIFENPKQTVVNQKAQELLGLTYEQFRQVIVLPQGKFETLLVSNSEEKEKILVSLFRAGRWDTLTKRLMATVNERDSALKEEYRGISSKLNEYQCETLEELSTALSGLEDSLTALERNHNAATKQLKSAEDAYQKGLLDNQKFLMLKDLENQLEDCKKLLPHYEKEEQHLSASRMAETIAPKHDALSDALAGEAQANTQLSTQQNAVFAAETAVKNANSAANAHEQKRSAYEANNRQLTLLIGARPLYQTLEEKKREVAVKTAAQDTAQKKFSRTQKNLQGGKQQYEQAEIARDKLDQEYRSAHSIYLESIGSTLAQQLRPGIPCPVCGSTQHPCPAELHSAHISEAQLDELDQKLNNAGKAVREAMKRLNLLDAENNDAREAAHAASQEAAVAKGNYEEALSHRLAGIETTYELEKTVKKLEQEIQRFETEDTSVIQTKNTAETNLLVALTKQKDALEKQGIAQHIRIEKEQLWQEALSQAGFENEAHFKDVYIAPEEFIAREKELQAFHTRLSSAQLSYDKQKSTVQSQAAPDLPGLTKALEQAKENAESLAGQILLQKNQIQTMSRDLESLTRRFQNYTESRKKTDMDLEFARRLGGSSGLSLQRYILGVMLNTITNAANHLLHNVYGGRYQLYRTDEISGRGHKGGLELEVLDQSNHERRSVTTLSGGEKFLVALSLAIGLSTVVQAQGDGIRLEAMFIDEGFGSLDRESILDALDILQSIQKSTGVIGIISHVEQLADTIPSKLVITKSPQGSNCTMHL